MLTLCKHLENCEDWYTAQSTTPHGKSWYTPLVEENQAILPGQLDNKSKHYRDFIIIVNNGQHKRSLMVTWQKWC